MSWDKYVVVGGNPFRDYNNTTVYTSLSIIDKVPVGTEITREMIDEWMEISEGLFLIIDTETNEVAEI